jgi:hypothetical protein
VTALDTLRAKAQKAADALRDAESKAADEAAAIRDRNAERREAHWQKVAGDVLPVLAESVQGCRQAFTKAVEKGDGAEVLSAYLRHRRAFVQHAMVTNACAREQAVYVDKYTGKPTSDGTGQATYPHGIRPINSRPQEFLIMLDNALEAADQAHTAAIRRQVVTPLEQQLEPEDV